MSPVSISGPFVICDFGTADGGTAIAIISACIETVKRKYGDRQQLMIVFEDQKKNDFNSLINNVQGGSEAGGSYFNLESGVFITVCATDFYNQCIPDGYLDLGLCFIAEHWLSRRPCASDQQIFPNLMVGKNLRMFKEQAARDWETFLLYRSKELKPGGHLVNVCPAVDDQGQYFGHTRRLKLGLFERMTLVWTCLETDGKITQAEFEATLCNLFCRSLDEFRAPFEDESSPVYKSGMRIISAETRMVLCPFQEKWGNELSQDEDYHTAVAEHARSYVQSVRVWSYYSFRSGLCNSRSEEEKNAIVEEFFKRYEEDVIRAPNDHGHDAIIAFLHITKTF